MNAIPVCACKVKGCNCQTQILNPERAICLRCKSGSHASRKGYRFERGSK